MSLRVNECPVNVTGEGVGCLRANDLCVTKKTHTIGQRSDCRSSGSDKGGGIGLGLAGIAPPNFPEHRAVDT